MIYRCSQRKLHLELRFSELTELGGSAPFFVEELGLRPRTFKLAEACLSALKLASNLRSKANVAFNQR